MEESKDNKKYWLKLDKDFLKSPQMKVIKSMTNGKDYIIFYLSLMLESVETVGHLRFTSLVPYNAEMLSAITETNIDIVRSAIKIFCELGLMQIFDDGTIFLPEVPKITGKESESAERVRKFRAKQKQEMLETENKLEPKDNATRQKQFRAKKKCEEQHIPLIEDYINNKRYSGNYYIVIQRDRYKCSICGSTENLCVHHIDGYDENKSENNAINKMITLCRKCHSNIHNGEQIENDLLDAINYDSNEMLPCNTDVTNCNDNIDINKDIDIDIKKDINKYIYIVEQIVDYLNEKCKTNYKSTTKKTKSLIKARLDEGFTLDDFKKVIDIKSKQWLNTKWEEYLRPETLFGTKFESYLNKKNIKSDEELIDEMFDKLEME